MQKELKLVHFHDFSKLEIFQFIDLICNLFVRMYLTCPLKVCMPGEHKG